MTSVTGLAMTRFFARGTVGFFVVRRGGALPLPRAGKSAKRCRWQRKRAGFEEVPRLAATTVAGNRLARRWAREPRPYGGLQGVQWAGDRKGRPYERVTRGAGQVRAGRCGERTERCRWQRKRSERVAAVKILSVRRKAAQKFWTPQQDHRPLRRAARNVWAGYRPRRKFF